MVAGAQYVPRIGCSFGGVMDDISYGSEPVRIPVQGSADQINELLSTLTQYIVDSELPDGRSLGGTAPNDLLEADEIDHESVVGSDPDDHDDPDEWVCSCGLNTENEGGESELVASGAGKGRWLCTVEDGECDCVGSFGNFYSVPAVHDPSPSPCQRLNLDALPERLPLVECSSSCPCAERCANRVTQRGVSVSLTVRPSTSGVGFGLFYTPLLSTPLRRGTFISLYAGEYLSDSEARSRWHAQLPTHTGQREGREDGNYILSLRLPGQQVHVDPRRRGNVGRFLNHSCEANCVILPVRWGGGDGWYRAAIFTDRDIGPDQELSFDYATASGSKVPPSPLEHHRSGVDGTRGLQTDELGRGRTRCLCGAEKCRGWMPFDESL